MCEWVYGNNGKPYCTISGKQIVTCDETGDWCIDRCGEKKSVNLLLEKIQLFIQIEYDKWMNNNGKNKKYPGS